jgi:hypothetical protein
MLTKNNIKYIAPLSPLQEGIFYHYLMDRNSLSYFTQACFYIRGSIQEEIFQQAFQEIIDRYDILRTVFIQKDVLAPRQIILKEQKACFEYEDLSGRDVDRDALVKQLNEADKSKLFDLGKGKLIRLSLAKFEDNEYHLIWSHHHILMDGWCLTIIIEEFFKIYENLLNSRVFHMPAPVPYIQYIRWLENLDKNTSLSYWKNYLNDFDTRIRIPGIREYGNMSYQPGEVSLKLDKMCSETLLALGATYSVTLNTIIQCLWGTLLGKYNHCSDVIFGVVVSGRPPEIEGIEGMLGLFINTIPVRIKTGTSISFIELIQEVQRQAILSAPHHYVQLADVQNESLLGRELIDHIMVFENYTVSASVI